MTQKWLENIKFEQQVNISVNKPENRFCFGLKEIENSKLCFIRREIVKKNSKKNRKFSKNFTDSENSTNGIYFSINGPS